MVKRILLVALGLAAGAVIVFLLDGIGVPVAFAAAWLLLILAVALLSRAGLVDDGSWPPPRPEHRPRGSEVSRLAWNINSRTGAAGFVMARRVERVLRRRLARLGVDLDDPAQSRAVDALIGEGVREVFARPAVQRTDLERVMTAIDRLPSPTNQER
jgi:hypothetical protein